MRTVTDFSTLFSIVIALGLVVTAVMIGDNNPEGFLDVRSFLIVILGTFFLVIASFSFNDIWRSKSLIVRTVFYHADDPEDAGFSALEAAEYARKKGILALQNRDDLMYRHRFFTKGLTMVIDGMKVEEIQPLLRGEIAATAERHRISASILRKAAEISPAMGLIGTLIGLVQMLANLDDPASIGPAMAIALLTTLYGAILAYMVFIPLASKLERNSNNEILLMNVYLEAILSIGRKENPRRLEMAINAILPPSKRISYFI
jgi:chemotaxis protein MotA